MAAAALLEHTAPRLSQQRGLRPWQPGQSGNPAGRQKGSRNKLGEAFIQALHDKFVEHGDEVIDRVIRDKPDQFLKVVAAVIPQEVHHRVEDYDELSDDDLRAAFLGAAGAVQARIEARSGDAEAGTIKGSAREPD